MAPGDTTLGGFDSPGRSRGDWVGACCGREQRGAEGECDLLHCGPAYGKYEFGTHGMNRLLEVGAQITNSSALCFGEHCGCDLAVFDHGECEIKSVISMK